MISSKSNALATITALLLGLPVFGCSGGGAALPDFPATSGPVADGGADGADGAAGTITPNGTTYYKDLLPILQDHCQTCHVAGGIAPFTLSSYDDAKGMIDSMIDATQKRIMPPWGAQDTPDCKSPRPWMEDMRLSDAQIATIKAWRDGGKVEGDPKDAPPPPVAAATDLANANFTSTPTPYQITSTTKDTFRCFVVDPKITQTRWMNGTFFVPGNKEIVHHVVLFADPKGESAKLADANGSYDCFGGPNVSEPTVLAGWAPGQTPTEYPANVGTAITPGELLVMQIHYHPHGQDFSPDATKIEMRFVDTPPEYTATTKLIGNFGAPQGQDGLLPGPDDNGRTQFLIPANVSGHTETMRISVPQATGPVYVYGVMAHMHLIGAAEKVWVDHAAGGTECMLQVPSWNFNWQRIYRYDAPIEELPVVATGDKVTVQCTYDNTMQNPFMAQALADQGLSAPHDVRLGETTLDEMCLAPMIFLAKAK